MDPGSRKRKASPARPQEDRNKMAKNKKKWITTRKDVAEARAIHPGDVGIWATCAMKKEAPSVSDLRDLFQEYASKIYEVDHPDGTAEDRETEGEVDIEAEIAKEVSEIRKPGVEPLFTSVRLDTQCLIFFKTRKPVEPVSFVHQICKDAANGVERKRCRFVKRLTPISAIDKATERGLEIVAQQVLAPHFHGIEQAGKKFAIRTSIRNHTELTRDDLIKKVAAAVGPGHTVDLSGYELLILVEIYKNILGMSVVGADFDKLKRYNLAELPGATQPDLKDAPASS
ncbi:hypothetical protein BDV95DRAFT_630174 [Massariosphaeria phaeospora]|uniref:THUMP domain-containing protein n=1 Tax=Massariosphaeria phaeospora TaxID=100035 RepID=A0A7C8M597_9PLEO|nr:hypothetical protein BDV95DRAFT_630174 [Massariosphaeria phaeospora]